MGSLSPKFKLGNRQNESIISQTRINVQTTKLRVHSLDEFSNEIVNGPLQTYFTFYLKQSMWLTQKFIDKKFLLNKYLIMNRRCLTISIRRPDFHYFYNSEMLEELFLVKKKNQRILTIKVNKIT